MDAPAPHRQFAFLLINPLGDVHLTLGLPPLAATKQSTPHTRSMSEPQTPAKSMPGPLRIGVLAPPGLEFEFWERRLLEKLAADPRFEISALIIDGREKKTCRG